MSAFVDAGYGATSACSSCKGVVRWTRGLNRNEIVFAAKSRVTKCQGNKNLARPHPPSRPRVSAALRSRDAGEGRASLGDARVMATHKRGGAAP